MATGTRARVARILITTFFAAFLAVAPREPATALTLLDGNSIIEINPGVANTEDQDEGIIDWKIQNVDHLSQEWFWIREFNGVKEVPIGQFITSQSGDQTASATLTYEKPNVFTIDIDLVLNTFGVGSRLTETITVTNLTDDDLEFFEYSDFDLALSGAPLDQTQTSGFTGNLGQQQALTQIELPDGSAARLDFTTSSGDLREVRNDGSIKAKLADLDVDNLDNTNSSVSGDVSFALQWHVPGNDFITITKDKTLTPEPSTAALAALGLLGLALYGRKR